MNKKKVQYPSKFKHFPPNSNLSQQGAFQIPFFIPTMSPPLLVTRKCPTLNVKKSPKILRAVIDTFFHVDISEVNYVTC